MTDFNWLELLSTALMAVLGYIAGTRKGKK